MITAILSHCIISNIDICVIKAFIKEIRERRRYHESKYSIIHFSLIPTSPFLHLLLLYLFLFFPAFFFSLSLFFLPSSLKLRAFEILFILNHLSAPFIYSSFKISSLYKHSKKKIFLNKELSAICLSKLSIDDSILKTVLHSDDSDMKYPRNKHLRTIIAFFFFYRLPFLLPILDVA